MKKLEIKHLGRRLACELLLENQTNGIIYRLTSISVGEDIDVVEIDEEFIHENFQEHSLYYKHNLQFKPIFHPTSDLTKPITHKGEEFVPIEWFEIGDGENESIEYDYGNIKLIRSLKSWSKHGFVNDVNYLPHGVIEKLLEWNFVLDEPEGTWIDVNNLETNPYK